MNHLHTQQRRGKFAEYCVCNLLKPRIAAFAEEYECLDDFMRVRQAQIAGLNKNHRRRKGSRWAISEGHRRSACLLENTPSNRHFLRIDGRCTCFLQNPETRVRLCQAGHRFHSRQHHLPACFRQKRDVVTLGAVGCVAAQIDYMCVRIGEASPIQKLVGCGYGELCGDIDVLCFSCNYDYCSSGHTSNNTASYVTSPNRIALINRSVST